MFIFPIITLEILQGLQARGSSLSSQHLRSREAGGAEFKVKDIVGGVVISRTGKLETLSQTRIKENKNKLSQEDNGLVGEQLPNMHKARVKPSLHMYNSQNGLQTQSRNRGVSIVSPTTELWKSKARRQCILS